MKHFSKAHLLGLSVVFIISFGGELAAFTYNFTQTDQETMAGVSILLTSFFVGSILSSPLSIYLLERYQGNVIVMVSFLCSGIMVFLSSFYTYDLFFYVSSFILGIFSSLFWAFLAVFIPHTFEASNLIHVNGYVQSIRHMGYVLSPSLAGFINIVFSIHHALFFISFLFILSFLFAHFYFKTIQQSFIPLKTSSKISPAIGQLFQLPHMKSVLFPLIITISTTSTFNIAFIYLILNLLKYSKVTYGYLSGVLSLGLVIGPLLAVHVQKKGEAYGACLCAAVIGLCLCFTSMFHHVAALSLILFILGVFNGIQNSLMATFMMKHIPAHKRNRLMPTYLLVVQMAVLVGFFVGGFAPLVYAKHLLSLSGILALLAGCYGAKLNYYKNIRT